MTIERPTKTFVVSDTHFGHRNIRRFCHRAEDAEAAIISEWQQRVAPDDTIIHLGDVLYWRGEHAESYREVLRALPGEKRLILGNHDKLPREFYEGCGFEIIEPFTWEFTVGPTHVSVPENASAPKQSGSSFGSQRCLISFDHYPLDAGVLGSREFHVHGHIHNNGYAQKPPYDPVPFLFNQINISVEVTNYRPVRVSDLLGGLGL